MRGDKRRTLQFQQNKVTDHELGITIPLKKYLRGDLSRFYER